MIIVLSIYDSCDNGFTSSMMVGKKIYDRVFLDILRRAIDDRDVPTVVKEMNKLLDANKVYRRSEDGSYSIYACDNGYITKVMLIIDSTFQKAIDYSFISIYGKTTGREHYNGR